MTQKLSAVNRWCVTGTPVQRDLQGWKEEFLTLYVADVKPCICSLYLSDLYGLVLFLGVDPFSEFGWYKRLIWQPFLRGQEEPMLSLFARLMWRNSKADVADEVLHPCSSHFSLSSL